MSDGFPKVPAQATPPVSATASYARICEEQQPRLVAFARSLTRNNPWMAEDLVAEAHFRVWRRLSEGHEIENVPAYLMTTVRHLAATAAGDTRETPHDPRSAAERTEIADHAEGVADPAEQVSSVDLLVRVLGQLPERWVRALWLAEAEGQPLETVGQRIGAKQGATAVLLHRAREGMRQAFLRNQTGAPDDPACEVHWVRMPAYVRGNATPRQSERLLAHVDACADCRGRLAVLMRANDRLPALVGPALLVFAVGGAGKFLLPLAAGSAGASATLSGVLHTARQAVTGAAGTKAPAAVAAGATVAGAALAMMLALGTGGPAVTPAPTRVPLAEAPVGARPSEGPGAPGDAAVVAKEPEVRRSVDRERRVVVVEDDGSVGGGSVPVAVEPEPEPVTVTEPVTVVEPAPVAPPPPPPPVPVPAPPAPVTPPAPPEPEAPSPPETQTPPETPSAPEYPEPPSAPENPEPPQTETPPETTEPTPDPQPTPDDPESPEEPENPGSGCGN
ncbi:sigma-70 family RNA polymerase sigma factor [Streptomyces sp. NPDC093568]|uniref:sigma-70 family RNA polymerase sigma factor n=1 Tax=Streptomyces sp. NPDC093568 TaxID=3366041 RepID=UPI0037F9F632